MRALVPLVLLAACTADTTDNFDTDGGVDTESAYAFGSLPGPGLGNMSWSDDELFQPVGWIDNDNGVPEPSPDHPITMIKPHGTNSAYMHDGYLITLAAPDSGFAPGGFLVYDVSDPRDPQLVTRIYEPDAPDGRTHDFREAHAMGFSWRHGMKLVAIHTGTGMQIWDFTDVHDPQRLGEVDLPGVDFGDYENVAWQLTWQGSYVYVAGSGRGIYVVDVTDPAAPVLADRGGAPNPIPTSELGGFRVGPLFAIGNQLIVSSMDNESGYAVLDASDPLFPAILSARDDLEKFYAICFSGGRVFTSARGGGAKMLIDDVRDPFALKWDHTRLEIDKQLYCGTQDHFVFQGCEDEVVKVDVSDPSNPKIVGRGVLGRANTDHGQVTAFGNLVFVGNDHGTGSAFVVHETAPDISPPQVSFVSPHDEAITQGLLSRVGLTLTDNITVRTVGPDSFFVRPLGGEALDGLYTVQGHIVNFEPAQPLLPDTTYEVVVPAGGLTDWVGNPTAETFTSTFTTTALAPTEDAEAFAAALMGPATLVVGEEGTFELDVQGADAIEVSWRFGTDGTWQHLSDRVPLTHAFQEPGHHTVVASVSNGIRRLTATLPVTVHRPLPPVPPTRSHTLALDASRGHLWTANHDHDSVSLLDATTLEREAEVSVCASPRHLTVDAHGDVWVSCEGDGQVVILDGDSATVRDTVWFHPGSAPAGIVADPAGTTVFVALEAMGEVVSLDTVSREEQARLTVGSRPFGLAVSSDGQTVYATRKVSPDAGGVIYKLDAGLTTVSELLVAADDTTIDGEDRARGVPNYLLTPGLTPDEAELWIPAKQDNIFRGGWRDGEPLTHETTVRSVVPRMMLATGTERPGRRLDLNDRAPPVDVAFTPLGDYAFLALQGSDRVAAHDAYTGQPMGANAQSGDAVQGLLVSPDGLTLYAHHFLSRTVTAHDIQGVHDGSRFDLPRIARGHTVAVEALSPEVLLGKQLFYRARDPRMSKDGYIACASCHLDGADDGRVWDTTLRGEGLRNTIDLRGRAGRAHGPMHWTANFDEIQDFEHDIREGFGGRGFLDDADLHVGTRSTPLGDPKAGLSPELDALAAYVSSLDTFPPSPWRRIDGGLTEPASRGQQLYDDLLCSACHGEEAAVQGTLYDVGTLTSASGSRLGQPLSGLDAPTLRGLHATPPYLHDGSAETVFDALAARHAGEGLSVLSDEALQDLELYLLSLD